MFFSALAAILGSLGGGLAQAIPPLPRGGARCTSEVDCEMLGDCVHGHCRCDPGWTGATCGTLRLLPADPKRDLIWPQNAVKPGPHDGTTAARQHPISWGASLIVDDDGIEHLFAEVGCYTYVTDMHARGFQIVHLEGPREPPKSGGEEFLGPFAYKDTVLQQTRINPHVMRTPKGYAVFYVGYRHNSSNYTCTGAGVATAGALGADDPPIKPGECSNFDCYLAACQESQAKCENATGFPEWGHKCVWLNDNCVNDPYKSVFGLAVAEADSLDGPWTLKNIAIEGNGGLNQETNPSGVTLPGGDVLLAFRWSVPLPPPPPRYGVKGVGFYDNVTELIGVARAAVWGAPFVKIGPPSVPISTHQAEDPFIFRDSRGTIHILAHDIIRLNAVQCNNSGWAGAHFFSTDPAGAHGSWHTPPHYPSVITNCSDSAGFGPGAYHVNVTWTDGTRTTFFRRERPELVFNAQGEPTHFISGVERFAQDPGKPDNDQFSYTLVQRVDLSDE